MAKISIPTNPRFIDITGNRYNRLQVLEFAGNKKKHRMWKCVCDCGNESIVEGHGLKSGATKSCGCLQRESRKIATRTHGMRNTPLYGVWCTMHNRCKNPTTESYPRYGGRGITVCERWHDFANFYADMGPRPDGKSIERIDNEGNYSPDNCRWATAEEQANNKSDSRFLTVDGETLTVAQWARRVGIKMKTLHARVQNGWSHEDAVKRPLRPY